MTHHLPLRCRCGAVRGEVRDLAPHRVNHGTCYCRDCRAFARALGRADVLDAWGGTRIVQTSPLDVHLESGREHLACMRLSARGLLRWYADCCRTPIGNTPATPAWPFVGIIAACLVDAGDPEPAIGPARGVFWGESAIGGGAEADAIRARRTSPWLLLRFAAILWRARLAGARRKGTVFFGPDGEPTVEPRVLDAAAREAARTD